MSSLTPEVEALLQKQRVIRLGDEAPDFTAETQLGPFKLSDYQGSSWLVLFSHPRDFTPVCTTELGRAASLKEEWTKRNVKVAALSVDTAQHHKEWINDIADITKGNIDFPIIADHDYKVSVLYGMLDRTHISQGGMPYTVRSTFIIDPKHVVRLILTYPASTGRSFEEILRVIDSLQLADSHKVATVSDWKKGNEVVVLPTVSTADAEKMFPKGLRVVKPWLRYTPSPVE